MKKQKYLYLLCLPILCLFLAGTWMGCHDGNPSDMKRILVIHQYSDTPENYGERVEKIYEEQMNILDNQADVRHLYLDWPHMSLGKSTNAILLPEIDSLKKDGWKPDVIITHQDWAAHEALRLSVRDTSSWLHGIPIVAVGVEYGDSIFKEKAYKNVLTGFSSSVDFDKNLHFVRQITGSNDMSIELDSLPYIDNTVRRRLQETISDTTKYIDNSDFHINEGDEDLWNRIMEGNRIYINCLSFFCPSLNCPKDSTVSPDTLVKKNRWRYEALLRYAKENSWVQVRYSLACNTIIIRSRKPQFSVINAQFNNGKQLILGGYFPTLETEVADALNDANQILQGKRPNQIPVLCHQSNYYLDYLAMQKRGINYQLWRDHAEIVNVPFREQHPWLYWGLFALGTILILSVIIYASWYINQFIFNNKEVKLLLRRQRHDEWLFSDTNSSYFKLSGRHLVYTAHVKGGNPTKKDTVEELLEHTHPDDREAMYNFLTFNEDEGKHVTRGRLLDLEAGEYHWWSWEYKLTAEGASHQNLEGTVTKIDRQKKEEEQLIKEQQEAEETSIKEAFLANMTHDIRTPLNCITSFTSMLTDENMQLGEEERTMCTDTIKQNTQILLKLLNDVSNISEQRMGQYRYLYGEVAVVDLISQAYQSNQVLMPEAIDFHIETSDDVLLYIDRDRTMQVLNNFLSNAIKHTAHGSIVIGWHVETDTQQQEGNTRYVSLYVTDTGEGISEEGQKHVFDRFYKTDEANKGTGLGLSICSTIVEAQGGTIGVKSELGRGSTFWARFKEYVKGDAANEVSPNPIKSNPTQKS